MNAAIERLAAELMKLPAEEWDRLDELRAAREDGDTSGQGQKNEIETEATEKVGAGGTAIDAPEQAAVRSRNQT